MRNEERGERYGPMRRARGPVICAGFLPNLTYEAVVAELRETGMAHLHDSSTSNQTGHTPVI